MGRENVDQLCLFCFRNVTPELGLSPQGISMFCFCYMYPLLPVLCKCLEIQFISGKSTSYHPPNFPLTVHLSPPRSTAEREHNRNNKPRLLISTEDLQVLAANWMLLERHSLLRTPSAQSSQVGPPNSASHYICSCEDGAVFRAGR